MKLLLGLLLVTVSTFCQAKHFVIGVQDISYFPLYDFPNPSFAKELLDKFAEKKGYTFDYLPLPIKRINNWFSDNNIDFKFPDNSRWLGGDFDYDQVTYSEPIVELIACAVVSKNNRTITQQEVKKLGTLLGFHPTLWLDAIAQGKTELIESPSTLNIVRQVVFGSVDATNIEPNVVFHHLRLLKQEHTLVIADHIPFETYHYHLSTIKHQDILEQFNQFLRDNKPFIESLKKRYNILDPRPYRQWKKPAEQHKQKRQTP